MFHHVAGEDDVDAFVGEEGEVGDVSLDEFDLGVEVVGGVGVEVYADAAFAVEMVEEFAVAAAEVEDDVAGLDPALEKVFDDDLPDPLFGFLDGYAEAVFVELFYVEPAGGGRRFSVEFSVQGRCSLAWAGGVRGVRTRGLWSASVGRGPRRGRGRGCGVRAGSWLGGGFAWLRRGPIRRRGRFRCGR